MKQDSALVVLTVVTTAERMLSITTLHNLVEFRHTLIFRRLLNMLLDLARPMASSQHRAVRDSRDWWLL